MEGAPHWDHDDSRHIIEEVEKLVKDGLSARKAADQVQLSHLEHSAEDIRSKYKRYLRNGGRSHGNQICECRDGIVVSYTILLCVHLSWNTPDL